jgi:hypothetical protein
VSQSVAFDIDRFRTFSDQMRPVVDTNRVGQTPPPWGGAVPTAELLGPHLDEAAAHLPGPYHGAYFLPLRGALARLVVSHDLPPEVALLAEALGGAVWQHSPKYPKRAQLRQFLAVVSNYFRSFLSRAKRAALDLPSAAALPPLAVFRYRGDRGPFTLPGDLTRRLCGAEVGVVCLPEDYADAPVTWLTVAHETAGHDVLHADPTLLPDLTAGVRTIFGGGPIQPGEPLAAGQLLALLWGYWADEAASDVYAILNAGPSFAYNQAAFLAAMRGGLAALTASAEAGSRWDELDEHPPDLLRLHLAAGVIESLAELPGEVRRAHAANVRQLARAAEDGRQEVRFTGRVELERDHWVDLSKASVPLAEACESARRVGAYLATVRLRAFGGRSVQEIETWSAADSDVAARVAAAFRARESDRVQVMGDDAQLLAGATLALLEDPAAYSDVNQMLADALTASFETDPVVGFPLYHRMFGASPSPPPPPDSTEQDDPRDAAPKHPGPAVKP